MYVIVCNKVFAILSIVLKFSFHSIPTSCATSFPLDICHSYKTDISKVLVGTRSLTSVRRCAAKILTAIPKQKLRKVKTHPETQREFPRWGQVFGSKLGNVHSAAWVLKVYYFKILITKFFNV